MNRKQNQASVNWGSVFLTFTGGVIGAILMFLGTRANANAQVAAAQEAARAQITAAAINVYGPISTTQTAEARAVPVVTATTSAVGSAKSSQVAIPISNIKIDGKPIGDSFEINNFRVVDLELTSTQGENGYTIPDNRIRFIWDFPGSFEALKQLPMRGIQSTITISPLETRYSQELVFCHYSVKYLDYTYNSAEQFIPFDQPVTLVWDFTGWVDPSDFDLSAGEQKLVQDASDILNKKGSSFTYYFKRNGELWQWQKLAYDNYQPNDVQSLTVACNVSATEDFRGKNPGKEYTFRGKITFGDVIVFPYEQPSGNIP